jgi:hypothetical protein
LCGCCGLVPVKSTWAVRACLSIVIRTTTAVPLSCS